ncbi:MAG: hypothetical protein LUC37_01910 [Prevotella sp.]|nr:hypothetical protein [Prevotella sp.]
MEQKLLDKARSEIRAKMEARPFEELEKDWERSLDSMYGFDVIAKEIFDNGAVRGSDNYSSVSKAVYRSFSQSAIIFFEEFLKLDDERRTKE